jgi:PAS domain S-box-containing protein
MTNPAESTGTPGSDYLLELAAKLNAAGSMNELLALLADPTQNASPAWAALYQVTELDEAGNPAWGEVSETWAGGNTPPPLPVGMQFFTAQFPFTALWVKTAGNPLLIADVLDDDRLDKNSRISLSNSRSRALAVLPLTRGQHWVGFVTISWESAHPFDDTETSTYYAAGSLAAPLVENIRLRQQQQQRLDTTLFDISRRLSTAHDEEALLKILTQPSLESGVAVSMLSYIDSDAKNQPTWAEIAATWQKENSRATADLVAAIWSQIIAGSRQSGQSLASTGARYALPEFPFTALWFAGTSEPQLIANAAADHRLGEAAKSVLSQAGLQAMAVIPLALGEQWVGVISLFWATPHAFTESEIAIYRAFTALASPAIASRRRLTSATATATAQTETAYRFRALAEHSTEPLAICNPAGEIIFANASFAHLLRYQEETPPGHHLATLLPEATGVDGPPFPADITDTVQSLLAGRQEQRAIRRHDGRVIPADIATFPLTETGDVVVTLTDRSEIEQINAWPGIQQQLLNTLDTITDPQAGFIACLQAATEATGLEQARLYQLQPETGDLSLVAHHGLNPEQLAALQEAAGEPVAADGDLAGLLTAETAQYHSPDALAANPALMAGATALTAAAIVPVLQEQGPAAVMHLGSQTVETMPRFAPIPLQTLAGHISALINRQQDQADLSTTRQENSKQLHSVRSGAEAALVAAQAALRHEQDASQLKLEQALAAGREQAENELHQTQSHARDTLNHLVLLSGSRLQNSQAQATETLDTVQSQAATHFADLQTRLDTNLAQNSARMLAEVNTLRTEADTALVTLRQANQELQTELETTRAQAAAELEATQQQAAAELETARQQAAAELETTRQQAAAELETTKQQAAAELETAQQQAAAELETAQQQAAAELETTKQQAAAELETTKQQAQADLDATQQQADLKLKTERERSAVALVATTTQAKLNLEATQASARSELDTVQTEAKANLETVQQQARAGLEHAQAQAASQLEDIRHTLTTRHETALAQARLELDTTRQEAELALNQLSQTNQQLTSDLEATRQQARADLENTQAKAKADLETAQQQSEQALKTERQRSAAALTAAAAQAQLNLETTQAFALSELENAQTQAYTDLEATRQQAQADLEHAQAQAASQLENIRHTLTTRHETALTQARLELDTTRQEAELALNQLSQTNQQLTSDLEATRQQARADLDTTRQEAELALNQLSQTNQQLTSDLEATRQQARADLENTQAKAKADLDALQQQAERVLVDERERSTAALQAEKQRSAAALVAATSQAKVNLETTQAYALSELESIRTETGQQLQQVQGRVEQALTEARSQAQNGLQDTSQSAFSRLEALQTQATSTLQAITARQAHLLNSLAEWVCRIDTEGNIVTTNNAVEPLLGYTTTELTGSPLFNLLHPEQQHDIQNRFVQALVQQSADDAGGWSNITVTWLGKDGSPRYTRNTLTPDINEQGYLTGFYSTNVDLTPLHLARQESRGLARHIRATTELAAEISTATTPEKLLDQFVTGVQSRLEFDHVQIFVFDTATQSLVLRSPQPQQPPPPRPLAQSTGIVTDAARTMKTVATNDVTRYADYGPDPQHPHTLSQLAMPLIIAGQLWGVLDIHHNQINRFSQADIDLLNTLAAQLNFVATNLELQKQQRQAHQEQVALKQRITEVQKETIQTLPTPVIPLMGQMIAVPLIGKLDMVRTNNIIHALVQGVNAHRARAVMLDVSGVPAVDNSTVEYLNKIIESAKEHGMQTMVSGLPDDKVDQVIT